MATRKLAKRLGLLRQRSQSSGSKKLVISDQIFSYLIVIDFESTCWREKNNYGQEIVEFPAVLLNTSTGEVESEFHTYVQPQEHPILSEFCTELTGITQMQVEAGIPLQICLSRFNRWLQNLQLEKGVTFPNKQQTCPAPLPSQKLCTFLTWSDWDLGVCLQYECKRKQLHKPDVLNNWIDLRSTYRLFYNRKPKGLNGALQDLGIQFSGREHSGLDDSRNTARLAVRMMRDGCVMKITRSLERTPVMVKAMFGSNVRPAESKKEKLNIDKRETVLTTRNSFPLKDRQKLSCPEAIPGGLDTKENSSSVQSLKSPKTLLNVMTAPPCGQNGRPDAVKAASTVPVNSSHILCSNTISCFSNLPQPNWALQTGLLGEEEEDAELLVETEERCGSYDDVVLECDDALRDPDRQLDAEYISDFDSGCYEWEEPNHPRSPEGHIALEDNLRETNNHRKQHVTSKFKSTSEFLGNIFNCTTKTLERSASSESDACFAVPKVVNWSKLNQSKTGCIASPHLQSNLSGLHKNNQTNMFSPAHFKPFLPDKTSTPNTSSAKLKAVITKRTEPLKSSFTIYSEPKEKASGSSHHPSFGPQQIPKVLSSLSTNSFSFSFNRSSVSFTTKGQQKITSPLCACGRRAKRQVVSNGGPNHGRGFFCCPVRRSGGRGNMGKGCEFFKWESALMKSSSFSCLMPQSDR